MRSLTASAVFVGEGPGSARVGCVGSTSGTVVAVGGAGFSSAAWSPPLWTACNRAGIHDSRRPRRSRHRPRSRRRSPGPSRRRPFQPLVIRRPLPPRRHPHLHRPRGRAPSSPPLAPCRRSSGALGDPLVRAAAHRLVEQRPGGHQLEDLVRDRAVGAQLGPAGGAAPQVSSSASVEPLASSPSAISESAAANSSHRRPSSMSAKTSRKRFLPSAMHRLIFVYDQPVISPISAYEYPCALRVSARTSCGFSAFSASPLRTTRSRRARRSSGSGLSDAIESRGSRSSSSSGREDGVSRAGARADGARPALRAW